MHELKGSSKGTNITSTFPPFSRTVRKKSRTVHPCLGAFDPAHMEDTVKDPSFVWQKGLPAFGLGVGPPFDLFVVNHLNSTPYVQNYNLGWSIGHSDNIRVQLFYAGSQGHRLFRARDLNQPSPGFSSLAQTRRPFYPLFPDFAVVDTLETRSSSNYNSVLASTELHRHNLNIRSAFSLAHSIDDASDAIDRDFGVAFPQDSRSLLGEHASSSFDVRGRFSMSLVYEVPDEHHFGGITRFLLKGWQLSGTTALQSGHPFGIATLSNPSGTNEFADRPDLIGTPVTGSGRADDFLRFAAFSDKYANRFGTLPRNAVVGPHLAEVDAALKKSGKLSKVSERFTLQARIAVFNLLNHVNLALPDQLLSDGPDVFGK
jgi:hypothetical protein